MRVNVEKVLERDQKLSELDDRAGNTWATLEALPSAEVKCLFTLMFLKLFLHLFEKPFTFTFKTFNIQ